MQQILVSYEAPIRSNLQKKNTGSVGAMILSGPLENIDINIDIKMRRPFNLQRFASL